MRVMVMVKGDEVTEGGSLPPEEMEKMFAEMASSTKSWSTPAS